MRLHPEQCFTVPRAERLSVKRRRARKGGGAGGGAGGRICLKQKMPELSICVLPPTSKSESPNFSKFLNPKSLTSSIKIPESGRTTGMEGTEAIKGI